MLRKLYRYLQHPIDLIQIENDGIPVKTWPMELFKQENKAGIKSEMNSIALKIEKNIAYEFFSTSPEFTIIFGIKFTSSFNGISTSQDFIRKLYSSTISITKSGSCSTVSAIRHINNDLFNGMLFKNKVSHVTLGVVNHWKSESLEICKSGNKIYANNDNLESILKDHPNLLSSEKNYIGIEFEYYGSKNTPQYWLTIQVSDLNNERHVLNKKKLLKLMDILLK
jgi:hypothetical protein